MLPLVFLVNLTMATIVNFMGIPMTSNSTSEMEHLQALASIYKTQTNGDIDIRFTWANTLQTTAYSTLVTDMLATNDTSIDIYMIDVVWPGTFATRFLDLLAYDTLQNNIKGHNPNIGLNNIVNGRLVALPFFADYGLFYYRIDLLKKYGYATGPRTWAEMEAMALKIMGEEKKLGNSNLIGYVGQFSSYEGLTCNIMEWLHSRNAGSVIESDKNVTISSQAAIDTFAMVRGWFTNGMTPAYCRLYDEAATLAKWLAGETIFMRNWPYCVGETKSNPKPMFDKTKGVGWDVSVLPGLSGNMTAGI
jgi:trehalose/maltose transport system substrate-binding protein